MYHLFRPHSLQISLLNDSTHSSTQIFVEFSCALYSPIKHGRFSYGPSMVNRHEKSMVTGDQLVDPSMLKPGFQLLCRVSEGSHWSYRKLEKAGISHQPTGISRYFEHGLAEKEHVYTSWELPLTPSCPSYGIFWRLWVHQWSPRHKLLTLEFKIPGSFVAMPLSPDHLDRCLGISGYSYGGI